MRIKHLHLENFCGLKEFDSDFSDRTLVSGKNETGKSTVRNAIFYVLTGKLADGSAADGIRPHGKDGVDVDFVDITVALTIETDGRDIELKKTEKQKWTKHRGSEAPVYEGNITEYEINGIPKKQKDYQAYINDIVDAETLLYGTNAQAFLSLDTKKRRAKLMSLVGDSTIESIASADVKYSDIIPMLKDGTIDELIARSRKVIKEKNEQLKAVPIRIDELSKQIVERDFAELELLRNSLQNDIEKVDKEIKSGSNQAEIEELKQKKFELQFNINDCKRKAHEELMNKRHDLNTKIVQAGMEADGLRNTINEMEKQAKLWEQEIKDIEATIEELKPKYEEAKNKVFDSDKWFFDESSTICSLCGQRLPEERIEVLKKEFSLKKENAVKAFESEKNAEIEKIKNEGNSLAVKKNDLKKQLSERKTEIDNKSVLLKEFSHKEAEIKSELALLPVEPDMSDNKWYSELMNEDKTLGDSIKALESATVDTQALEDKKESLETELTHIHNQLAAADNNAKIDERIAELTAQQRELAQAIADEEKRRDLLEDLNKRYVEVLTDKVNSYFKVVKWRMFKPLITNSGFEQICEPCIDGTSYYRNLNHGNRILAELDICQTFQNIGGVKLPITIDDAESVDSWRIPDVDRQLIVFRRTDDEILTVKSIRVRSISQETL